MTRPYTGTTDGVSKTKRVGTELIYRNIQTLTAGEIRGLGTHVIRNMRGKPQLSVHATGRAMDFGYKNRRAGVRLIRALVACQEELGLEFLADYAVKPYGRGWSCRRMGWVKYTKQTINPNGANLIHVEISPAVADSADLAGGERLDVSVDQLRPDSLRLRYAVGGACIRSAHSCSSLGAMIGSELVPERAAMPLPIA